MSEHWTTTDTDKAEVTLRFHMLEPGYYVGGKNPRTVRCATCGKTAIRTTYRFVHHQVIGLDSKNNPLSRDESWCPVPAALTGAQRDAMVCIRDGVKKDFDKVALVELQKRGLLERNSRVLTLTKAGRLLLEEGW